MAIYHVRLEKGGGYSIEAEMRAGRERLLSGRFMAKDKDALRQQAQNLGLIVNDRRVALSLGRLAQVNRGGE